jgi:nucleotide-binding universal stress UspA family protein
MFKNILVPTDGSTLSRKAIRQAVQLAKEQGARVTGLHVVPPYSPDIREDFSSRNFVSPQEYAKRSAAAARGPLKVIERAARAAGVACETLHTASSFPHDAIVRTAQRKKCDAIYMASHGRRGIARLLLGSEASKVLALSKVPVIISK